MRIRPPGCWLAVADARTLALGDSLRYPGEGWGLATGGPAAARP